VGIPQKPELAGFPARLPSDWPSPLMKNRDDGANVSADDEVDAVRELSEECALDRFDNNWKLVWVL